MTEWEGLRRELHQPLGEQVGAIDVDTVMRAGRRLRWRRRLVVAGTAAAVLAAGSVAPLLYRSSLPETPVSSGVAASAASPADVRAAGDVIRAGDGNGRVFYMEYDPDGRLQLVTGWEVGASVVVQGVASAAREGVPDREPGFHVLALPGEDSMVFGYYVGRPARITAVLDGAPQDAVLRPWSEDPAIVIFWFPRVPSSSPTVTGLSAYDAERRLLGTAPPYRAPTPATTTATTPATPPAMVTDGPPPMVTDGPPGNPVGTAD